MEISADTVGDFFSKWAEFVTGSAQPVLSMLLAAALVAILCFCSSREGDGQSTHSELLFSLTSGLLMKTGEVCGQKLISITKYITYSLLSLLLLLLQFICVFESHLFKSVDY